MRVLGGVGCCWLLVAGERQNQIPFGDDRQKGKGKSEKQIPFGDDRKKGKGKGEKGIPFGDDNKKGNGNDKDGRQRRRAARSAALFDLYI